MNARSTLVIVTQPKKEGLHRWQGGPRCSQIRAGGWGEGSRGQGGGVSKHRLSIHQSLSTEEGVLTHNRNVQCR